MLRVICAGFGGQGILTSGLLLAKISVEKGKQCTWVPSYGSEMRGGTASCRIKLSDERIHNPFFTELDLLLGMNRGSMDSYAAQVAPGGTIVADSTVIGEYDYPDGVKIIAIPATGWATELKNSRGANLLMLGAAIGASKLFAAEEFADAVDAFFASKGKNFPANRECFLKGYNAAANQ